jgi:hypothetical protein
MVHFVKAYKLEREQVFHAGHEEHGEISKAATA